ncbi:uncharacterized protein LOC121929737 [Sceloporus undulatus]|uniref:uncharacterized protein LOC121929737 n=1 Tax=Sceloporus undulatus TaxID=8520 RepID=UPI001C4CC17E|nr:uncharacterized protein LOC121929737 [Sceloporus undulatus]
MAQSGYMSGTHRSPNACKHKQDHRRLDGVRQGPQLGANAVDDDWETDPDYVNNGGSRRSGDHAISTASIIADLSRAIRDGSLGKSSWHSKKEYANLQGHHRGYKRSEGNYLEDRHTLPRLHGDPAPGASIERPSLINRNTAEKLDSFFSEKLRVWGSDTAQRSDTYENTEGAHEERDVHRRHNGKGHASPDEASMRRTHGWVTDGSGDTVAEYPRSSREMCDPPAVCQDAGLWHPWHSLTGKGRALEGPLSKQEGSRPSTTVSSSARILPRCRISHVQRCRACQAFNQNQPTPPYENCWTTLQEEDQGGLSDPHQKERTPPSSFRQQISDRLSKVQHWLEQTPVERPRGPDHWRQQRHSIRHQLNPEAQAWCPVYAPQGLKEGDLWGRAGDARASRRLDPVAETRHVWETHLGETPHCHQPVAQILPCEDASTSPATCTCLFCEEQRPGTRLVTDKTRPDPSAAEVSLRLQSENRISRIVEAFERRTLREAKMAEQERAFESTRQRDLERREVEKRRGRGPKAGRDPKRGHCSSSTRAHKSHPKEKNGEEKEEERKKHGESRTWEDPKGKESLRARKRPSFMDRLRGIR